MWKKIRPWSHHPPGPKLKHVTRHSDIIYLLVAPVLPVNFSFHFFHSFSKKNKHLSPVPLLFHLARWSRAVACAWVLPELRSNAGQRGARIAHFCTEIQTGKMEMTNHINDME